VCALRLPALALPRRGRDPLLALPVRGRGQPPHGRRDECGGTGASRRSAHRRSSASGGARSSLSLPRVRWDQARHLGKVCPLPLPSRAPAQADQRRGAQGRSLPCVRWQEESEVAPVPRLPLRRSTPSLRGQPCDHLPRLRGAQDAQGKSLPEVPQPARVRNRLPRRAPCPPHLPEVRRAKKAQAGPTVSGMRAARSPPEASPLAVWRRRERAEARLEDGGGFARRLSPEPEPCSTALKPSLRRHKGPPSTETITVLRRAPPPRPARVRTKEHVGVDWT
jgi:hypothetical protein